jgi:hypothetical protein
VVPLPLWTLGGWLLRSLLLAVLSSGLLLA